MSSHKYNDTQELPILLSKSLDVEKKINNSNNINNKLILTLLNQQKDQNKIIQKLSFSINEIKQLCNKISDNTCTIDEKLSQFDIESNESDDLSGENM